jgi:hypothetical protein
MIRRALFFGLVVVAAALFWHETYLAPPLSPAPGAVVATLVGPQDPVVLTATEPPPLAAPPPSIRSLNDGFCDPPDEPRARPHVPLSAAAARIPGVQSALGAAEAARKVKDSAAERAALARALALAPEEPILAFGYGLKAIHSPDYPASIDALSRYLAKVPSDAHITRLRSLLETQVEIQKDFALLRSTRGLSLAYPKDAPEGAIAPHNAERPDAGAALDEIDLALDEAARLTGTERRKELYAVLYRDRSELLAVTCAPAWSGAVYDGTLRIPLDAGKVTGAHLRHETLHAQLIPSIGTSPRWFHEGLAQYFEDRGQFRWRQGFGLMVKNHTYVPFSSLDGSFYVFEQDEDAMLAYDQSAAMLYLLVEREGEAGIARAVSLLKSGAPADQLSSALGLTDTDLLAMLAAKQPPRGG